MQCIYLHSKYSRQKLNIEVDNSRLNKYMLKHPENREIDRKKKTQTHTHTYTNTRKEKM